MKIQNKQLLTGLVPEFENILQFWINKGIDSKNGGFHGEVDFTGVPINNAPKGVVLNARILWTFSVAYNFLKKEEYLEMAHRAYDYLTNFCWDEEHGGLFWSVSHDGKMLDSRKQIYAQGFGIYGFSEYYKASGKAGSLEYAIELYNLIEKYSFDQIQGGYVEALTRDWMPLDDMRLSAKDANEPKSMNTHLHIIEPYTNLYRVWPNANLAKQIRGLIRVFLDRIICQKTGHLHLFFEMDWKVKGSMISYGHDIEATWLLCEAAEVLGDHTLIKEVEAVAIKMTDATINEGLAPDGSLIYENDPQTNHIEDDRHWWVQAEALVGFMNAWQITGNQLYLKKMEKVWDFISCKVIDTRFGEWLLRVDNNGNPVLSDPKIGFWKCPYHNTRALMEVDQRIKANINNLN